MVKGQLSFACFASYITSEYTACTDAEILKEYVRFWTPIS